MKKARARNPCESRTRVIPRLCTVQSPSDDILYDHV